MGKAKRLLMKKVAIIVETRKHKALPFVLNNVMSILPDDWALQIFHGTNNFEYVVDIIKSNKLFDSKKVYIYDLGIESIKQQETSLKIMLNKKFWEGVVGETVLYFECDTMLCPNSDYKVEDFEHFDYIGGWWGSNFNPNSTNETYDRVMNGGLSIRKKSWMMDIIDKNLEMYLKNGGNSCEDYFVSDCVVEKPFVKEVLSFSIDNGYMYPLNDKAPFGLHKPWGEGKIGHGRYYEDIKRVCEDVEKLGELNGL